MKALSVIAAGALLALLAAGGCSRRIYVPVESRSRSTDTLIDIRLRADTFLARDSVVVCIRGDTLRERVVRERTRLRLVRDTVRDVRRDTVVETRMVEVEKKSPRSFFRTAGESAGWMMAGAALGVVAVIVWRRRTRGH